MIRPGEPASNRSPGPRTSIDRIAIGIATVGGAGFVPGAPGTAGAVVGGIIYLSLVSLGVPSLHIPLTLGLLILGTWAASHTENIYGHDSSKIVVDEVVGQLVALGFITRAPMSELLLGTALGFLLFRFFDILKPFPIRRLEDLGGGLGIMADDLGAGMYALLALLLLEPIVGRVAGIT